MEYLNKIELKGTVGTVRRESFIDVDSTRFSLATTVSYKGNSNLPVMETTWFDCIAVESPKIDLSVIEKGANLHVYGRLKARKISGADGDKVIYSVIVSSLKKI